LLACHQVVPATALQVEAPRTWPNDDAVFTAMEAHVVRGQVVSRWAEVAPRPMSYPIGQAAWDGSARERIHTPRLPDNDPRSQLFTAQSDAELGADACRRQGIRTVNNLQRQCHINLAYPCVKTLLLQSTREVPVALESRFIECEHVPASTRASVSLLLCVSEIL
jgi:hypothetical protein